MSIVTISRGSFSRGKEVAEQLSLKIGYECVSKEILLEASEEFNISEGILTKAVHDSNTVMERFSHDKMKLITYYRYSLLKHACKDNLVYHGLAGQYFLKELDNVLKVKILANMEDRIREVVKRDKVSENKALNIIKKDDRERRKWALQMYGIDPWDSRLYDIVLNIHKISVDDAVNILCEALKNDSFKTSDYARKKVSNLAIATKIQSIMLDYSFLVEVKVKEKTAYISNAGDIMRNDDVVQAKVQELIIGIEGIESVEFLDKKSGAPIHINPFHNM